MKHQQCIQKASRQSAEAGHTRRVFRESPEPANQNPLQPRARGNDKARTISTPGTAGDNRSVLRSWAHWREQLPIRLAVVRYRGAPPGSSCFYARIKLTHQRQGRLFCGCSTGQNKTSVCLFPHLFPRQSIGVCARAPQIAVRRSLGRSVVWRLSQVHRQ